MANLILTLLAIASVIPFVVMIVSFVRNTKKRKRYSECVGTIVRIWKRPSPGERSNQQLVSPIVSYTVHGKKYEMVGTTYTTNIKIGQEVVILFDKDDPSKAIMKKGLYFMPFLSGIAGLGFTAAFLIVAALKYAGLISF